MLEGKVKMFAQELNKAEREFAVLMHETYEISSPDEAYLARRNCFGGRFVGLA